MSYQVLARKWRPRTFQDMVGQEHILRMLTNALLQHRIHHAYLFTGTRGVGKTTLGRILAKCLNCESGMTPAPCTRCHPCVAIDAGQFLDLYEVDAASRTKVEDTKELLDNILYPPTEGRYKIYLIDEVHMLSNHSFNALLKTLEEPPEHVKFLLATTDPKRLPITILSRCLQFHLKRMTVSQIAQHLHHICTIEKINSDIEALEKLAKAADGSMRDALSLLDQAIVFGHGDITEEEVYAMLGSVAQDDVLPLLEALARRDGKHLFNVIAELAKRAPDFQQVLDELINILHTIAITQIVPNAISNDTPHTPLTNRFTPEEVQLYYQIALLGRRDLAHVSNPQQGFEMTMLRMLAFTPRSIEAENAAKTSPPKPPCHDTTHEEVKALPEWRELLSKLELSGMAYALSTNCTLQKMVGNKVTLELSANHQPMLNQKLQERIEEAMSRYFKQPIQLEILITKASLFTPMKQEEYAKEERLAKATQTVMQDATVKQLIEIYDATVEVSLLS